MTPDNRSSLAILAKDAEERNLSVEATLRLIAEEMPHVTAAEIEEFFAVDAELKKQDASVYYAQAEASHQIADILREAGGRNLEQAIPILTTRAANGDARAVELLAKLHGASLVVGLE